MKRMILAVLSLILCLGLTGCSSFKEGLKAGFEENFEVESNE